MCLIRSSQSLTLGCSASGESDRTLSDLTPEEHRSSQSMIRLRQDLISCSWFPYFWFDDSMDVFMDVLHKDMEKTISFVDYKGTASWKNRLVTNLLQLKLADGLPSAGLKSVRDQCNEISIFADAFAKKYPTYRIQSIRYLKCSEIYTILKIDGNPFKGVKKTGEYYISCSVYFERVDDDCSGTM